MFEYLISRNLHIINTIIILCQIFNIIKYVFIILCDLSYESRMNLFDWSLFIGGLQIYTNIMLTIALIWALLLRILFYYTTNESLMVWTKLISVVTGEINKNQLGLHKRHLSLVDKLNIRFKR